MFNNGTNPKDLAAREERDKQLQVLYYMDLADCAMAEETMLEQHDGLCRLQKLIADDYPDSVAPNPGKIMYFPTVRVQDTTKPYYGEDKDLELKVFNIMFFFDVDYKESTGIEGDDIYFLTLAIWYEVCRLRGMLKIKGIKISGFEAAAAPESNKESATSDAASLQTDGVPGIELPFHFALKEKDGVSLSTLLVAIKKARWVGENLSEADWIYRMTGRLPDEGYPSPDPIELGSISQCRYIAKKIIFPGRYLYKKDWDMLAQVFTAKKGKMANVSGATKIPAGCAYVEQALRGTPVSFVRNKKE